MGPAGEKAAGTLGKVASAAGKASLVFAGLEVLEVVADHFGSASANVDKLTDSLNNFSATGKVSGELSNVFGSDLSQLGKNAQTAEAATHGFWGGLNDLTSSIPGVHGAVDTLNESLFGLSFNKATDNMAALDTAMSSSITTINDYNKASALWQQALTKSGLNTDQLAKLLPNTYKELQKESAASESSAGSLNKYSGSAAAAKSKLGDLSSALQKGADAQTKYSTEADAVAGAARGERDAIGALFSLLKAETDPVFGLIDAQKKLADAQKAYTKAVKEHGKNSKEARAADIDSAQAALGLQNAVGNLSTTFNGKLDPAFRKTLQNAKLSKSQIKDVEKAFGDAKKSADRYTGDYKGKASAPGATQAKKDIDKAYAAGKQYDGTYIARLSINGETQVNSKLDALLVKQRALQTGLSVSAARGAVQRDLDANRQKVYGHAATGGHIIGPGSGTSDDIPTMLSNGEYVIRASSVRKIGLPHLDHMTSAGRCPAGFGPRSPGASWARWATCRSPAWRPAGRWDGSSPRTWGRPRSRRGPRCCRTSRAARPRRSCVRRTGSRTSGRRRVRAATTAPASCRRSTTCSTAGARTATPSPPAACPAAGSPSPASAAR
jgi:hypothetical protein